jgi:hypothetical protein
MAQTDPRVDAYIDAAAPFAQPILRHLRALIHAAAPQVQETIKWGMPFFEQDGPICHFAAFKQHCALGFWKSERVTGGDAVSDAAMGQFGRMTALGELPDDARLTAYVHKALELNAAGVKAPWQARRAAASKAAPRPVVIPEVLSTALQARPEVAARFEAMSPSARRDYAEWIAEAKRDDTRAKRLATALEWIDEGKSRNWKYERR